MGRDLASCLLAYWRLRKPAGSSWIHLTLGSHDHSFLRSHSKNVYKCRRTGRLPGEQEVGVWSAVFGRDDQVGKNKWSGRTCSCSRCDPRPSSSPCFQREEVEIKKNQMEARCPFHWLIVFCSFPSPSAAWECLWKINRKWGCFSDIYSGGGVISEELLWTRACVYVSPSVCVFFSSRSWLIQKGRKQLRFFPWNSGKIASDRPQGLFLFAGGSRYLPELMIVQAAAKNAAHCTPLWYQRRPTSSYVSLISRLE